MCSKMEIGNAFYASQSGEGAIVEPQLFEPSKLTNVNINDRGPVTRTSLTITWGHYRSNGFETASPMSLLDCVIVAATSAITNRRVADLRMHILDDTPMQRRCIRRRGRSRRQTTMATNTSAHASTISNTAAGEGWRVPCQRGPTETR
jgi:hypothetical protein